jgi:hypothetical protein
MVIAKITHAVSGILGIFHLFFAGMLSEYWEHTQPSHPDTASGATVRWETTDTSSSFSSTHVVYITVYDKTVWDAFLVVGIVFLLICGALTLFLKMDARRNGRTSLY